MDHEIASRESREPRARSRSRVVVAQNPGQRAAGRAGARLGQLALAVLLAAVVGMGHIEEADAAGRTLCAATPEFGTWENREPGRWLTSHVTIGVYGDGSCRMRVRSYPIGCLDPVCPVGKTFLYHEGPGLRTPPRGDGSVWATVPAWAYTLRIHATLAADRRHLWVSTTVHRGTLGDPTTTVEYLTKAA